MTTSNFYVQKASIQFDGSADYLTLANQGSGVANLNPANTDAFSISTWFYTENSTGTYEVLMSNQQSGHPYTGYALKLKDEGTGQFLQYVNYNSAGQAKRATGVVTGSNDTVIVHFRWNCVCVTYDGSDDIRNVKIYFNGTPMPLTFSGTTIGATDSSGAINIGRANWSSSHFQGGICSTAFWNKELSQKEVSEIYRGRGGAVGPGDLRRHSATANCIGWWIADNPNDAYNGTIFDQKGSFDMTPTSLASDALQDLAP